MRVFLYLYLSCVYQSYQGLMWLIRDENIGGPMTMEHHIIACTNVASYLGLVITLLHVLRPFMVEQWNASMAKATAALIVSALRIIRMAAEL